MVPRARSKLRSEECKSSTLSATWFNGLTCQIGRICRQQLPTWRHSVATQTCSNFFGNTMPTLRWWHLRVWAHYTWRLKEISRKVLISSYPEKSPPLWMRWINQELRLSFGQLIAEVRLPLLIYSLSPRSKSMLRIERARRPCICAYRHPMAPNLSISSSDSWLRVLISKSKIRKGRGLLIYAKSASVKAISLWMLSTVWSRLTQITKAGGKTLRRV